MYVLRSGFDLLYDAAKLVVFRLTSNDPERAHEMFEHACEFLYRNGLDRVVLDNKANGYRPPFKLSNAAGFNKDGKIPPSTLKYLGFDRVVIGTVLHDKWEGNPRPRIRRYPGTRSMLNWIYLQSDGSRAVAERLLEYGDHGVPLIINIMPTPGKEGHELLQDLEDNVADFRSNRYVDGLELNVSCPNKKAGEADPRGKYQKQLAGMLGVVSGAKYLFQDLYIKVSPDLEPEEVRETLDVARDYPVNGFTISNTTTTHDPRYIPDSPGKVGASGDAVYEASLRTQRMFEELMTEYDRDWEINICGGISSLERLDERFSERVRGIQVLTPLVFSGTRLMRKLREYRVENK